MANLSWPKLLEKLLGGAELYENEAKSLMQAWLGNQLSPVQTGAFLTALRAKNPKVST